MPKVYSVDVIEVRHVKISYLIEVEGPVCAEMIQEIMDKADKGETNGEEHLADLGVTDRIVDISTLNREE